MAHQNKRDDLQKKEIKPGSIPNKNPQQQPLKHTDKPCQNPNPTKNTNW